MMKNLILKLSPNFAPYISKQTQILSNFNKISFRKFSDMNKQVKKQNFLDRLKEKFSIGAEEKINIEKLANRNEEEDNIKATKLEALDEELWGELRKEEGSLDIDQIDTDIQVKVKSEIEKDKLFGNPLEILNKKFGINTKLFKSLEKAFYEKLEYSKDVAPSIEVLNKAGFSDFQIKVLVGKL